MNYNVVNM